MLSQVTLDDHTGTPVTIHLDSSTSKAFASNATGLIGGVVSAPRQNKSTRPNAHGAVNNTKYTDGDSISLSCEVQGTSIEDALTQFRTISAVCLQTLDYGPALLKWQEGATGLALQRLVKLDGPIDPPISDGVSKLTFQLQFFAEDPRAYNQTPTTTGTVTVSSTLLANGTFAADTAGAAPAHWTTSGTFGTAQVQAAVYGSWSKCYWLANTTLAAGTSAQSTSDKFAVSASTDYAVAIVGSGSIGTNGSVKLGVNFYDSGGTLIAGSSGAVDTITALPSNSPSIHYGILAGRVTSPSNAATAAVYIQYTASSAGAANINAFWWGVTFGPTPTLTVTNNGTRDTPLAVTTTFPAGSVTVNGGGAFVALTNSRWSLLSSGDSAVIDTGLRTVTATLSGNLLAYLTAASAVWSNLSKGSSTVAVTGIVLGGSVSATYRDAY